MKRDAGLVDVGAALAAECAELLNTREPAVVPPSSKREPIKVALTVREVDDPALRARLGRLLGRLLWPDGAA